MHALLVASRAVHFASAILLFGELVFVLLVAQPAWRASRTEEAPEDRNVHRHLFLVALLSVGLSIVSGAAWLAAEAASMSGLPLPRAIGSDTLGVVLGKTVFGRVWSLRFVIVVTIGSLLVAAHRSSERRRRWRFELGTLVLAAVYLATLAWAGHAASGQGRERLVQLSSDVIHLLAAGAWLGALPGLVFLLGRDHAPGSSVQATRRFSNVGVASVAALILSGFLNAWFLVGSVPALIGTTYGQLLLAKLCLVLLMVSLAAVNRLRLTPRLEGQDDTARRLLRRNAMLETAIGVGVVVIVAALGVTVPGAHQSPVWPFEYTLSWEPAEDSAAVGWALAGAGVLACLAAGCCLWGAYARWPRAGIAGICGVIAATAFAGWLLAVPAYPTTYVQAPVRYTVAAIAAGAPLYGADCAICHGIHGYGDGPAAASLPIKPANLVEHASHHPAGDLFWRIGHGIAGTPMPAFAPRLDDTAIWDLIQYVRALSEAEEAKSLTGQVEPWRPIVAPDFTFESPGRGQESLNAQRGRGFTLLVLYTLPASLPRLRMLAASRQALARAGVRVIALPADASAPLDVKTPSDEAPMFPVASADVAKAYAMFARRSADAGDAAPTHLEFLVDRDGYLRARWLGVHATTDRTAGILRGVEVLEREPPRAPAPEGHMHMH